MSLKLKSGDLSVKIPTLTDESSYRIWDQALKNSLGSVSLNKYIEYDIKEPILLEPLDAEFFRMAEVNAKITYTHAKRIPTEQKRIIAYSNKSKIYTKSMPKDVPRQFMDVIIKVDLLIIQEYS